MGNPELFISFKPEDDVLYIPHLELEVPAHVLHIGTVGLNTDAFGWQSVMLTGELKTARTPELDAATAERDPAVIAAVAKQTYFATLLTAVSRPSANFTGHAALVDGIDLTPPRLAALSYSNGGRVLEQTYEADDDEAHSELADMYRDADFVAIENDIRLPEEQWHALEKIHDSVRSLVLDSMTHMISAEEAQTKVAAKLAAAQS